MLQVFRIVSFLLIAVVLSIGVLLVGGMVPSVPYDLRVVESGSMAPTIPTGAVVVIQPRERYYVGDIITYQRRGGTEVTTHRIVSERLDAGEQRFVTQGDANNTLDAYTIEPAEIIGSVSWHVPYLGYVLRVFQSPVGYFLLIGVPALLLIIEQVTIVRQEAAVVRSEAKKKYDTTL
jgi:signal peptidase